MKKTISFALIGLILNALFFVSTAKANNPTNTEAKKAEAIAKLKSDLQKIGTGEDSKVKIKLNDGKKVSGYLKEINDDNFVIISKDNRDNRIPYHHVRSAHGRSSRDYFVYSMVALIATLLGGLLYSVSK